MVMLKAATSAHLKDYRDGTELLVRRWPNTWGAIAEVENHLRWSQWDRMLEEGIHDGTREQDAGWSQIIDLKKKKIWSIFCFQETHLISYFVIFMINPPLSILN